jgi:uncharacterized membrane protein YjdF
MGSRESESVLGLRDRLAPSSDEPAHFFASVSMAGALLAVVTGSIDATLFLVFTFAAMLLVQRLRLPTVFELAVAVGFVLQGWGNALLLFERIGWYDKAVHFLTPLLLIPALYLLLARTEVLTSPRNHRLRRGALGVFVMTAALGTALAAVWELVEGTADRALGMSLAHGYFETIDDLYCSLLGSVAAGVLLAWLATGDHRHLVDEAPLATR